VDLLEDYRNADPVLLIGLTPPQRSIPPDTIRSNDGEQCEPVSAGDRTSEVERSNPAPGFCD
jgi:hypothetical protein